MDKWHNNNIIYDAVVSLNRRKRAENGYIWLLKYTEMKSHLMDLLPWERACGTDERFHYMSGGYLVQMLTEWEIGLSSDAMDLMQRMLFLDPKDRLSLEQVRAHPWMVNGRREHPLGLQRNR
jgi:serine/threonine protein kinase